MPLVLRSGNNDNVISIGRKDRNPSGGLQLQGEAVNDYVNDATVFITIYECDGITEVPGQVWPAAVPYVPSSDGVYYLLLDKAVSLLPSTYVRVLMTASTPGGLDVEWDEIIPVRKLTLRGV